MPQHSSHARIHGKKRYHVRLALPIDQVHHDHRKHALKAVAQKRYKAGLPAHGAKGVGRSRVAAPLLSDVYVMKLAVQISGLQ